MTDFEEMFWDSFFAHVDAGEIMPAATTGSSCRVCGCTDLNACPGGCFWVQPDLCSTCYHEMVDDEPEEREDQ